MYTGQMAAAICCACCVLLYCTGRVDAPKGVEVAEAGPAGAPGAVLWRLLLACALGGVSCSGEAVLLLAVGGSPAPLTGCVDALAAAKMARSTAGSCLEAGCSSITFHAASVTSGQHERCAASVSIPSRGTRAPDAASCWQLPGDAVSCSAASARALLREAAAAVLSSGASCAACSAMASAVGRLISWMMLRTGT